MNAMRSALLPLQGRHVAVTGAAGAFGSALLRRLHGQGARLLALTSRPTAVELSDASGQPIPLSSLCWGCGGEAALRDQLLDVDILVINHGVNVHGDRSPAAVERSLEVNALSSWRLVELFLSLPEPAADRPRRELWVNTSEAELMPAVSPLYEISKRLLGQLLSLRSLDQQGPRACRIRRLVLGPFRSALNPIGVMSADFVAGQVIAQVRRGMVLVIVTPNPLTYLLFPLAVLMRRLYFGLTSRSI